MEHAVNRLGGRLVGTYLRVALNLDIERQAALPPGAKIIAANHPTTSDPFYLLALVAEPLLRAAGHIEVQRDNGRAAFDAALRRLRAGSSVGIFPEGRLSPQDGGVGRLRTGAIRLALETGAPVIPVGIGLDRSLIWRVPMTRGELSETARWYVRGPYAVTVGEPMWFAGEVDDHAHVRALTDQLAARIEQLARASARRLAAGRMVAATAGAS